MPIQRMVVYAIEAPRTPSMAMPTAARRCEGVASGIVEAGFEAVDEAEGERGVTSEGAPSVVSGVVEEEKREVGRAMRMTPSNDTTPEICSVRVKGSCRSLLQAQQAMIGARKVRTVASARGRY